MSEVVEEIRPPQPTHKAVIRRRSDGHLQGALYRWVDEDVPGHGHIASFWSEVRTAASIVDTLVAARAIARELLRDHAPSWSVS